MTARTANELYGAGPIRQALPLLRALNEMPPNEKAKAALEYVEQRLANPDDEWWPRPLG